MVYLGYALSSFFFLTVIIMLLFYLFLCFRRKTKKANNLILLIFLHSFFTIMVESWSLVLMNGGYNIIFALKIDYSIILYFALPLLLFVEIEDFILRRSVTKSEYGVYNFFRFLLPTLTMFLIVIAFGIFFFTTHYFLFLLS